MSDVVNKITMQIIKSVHTPDYNSNEWWINPNLPNCDQKYWYNNNGVLSEMSAIDKEKIDIELSENQKQQEDTETINKLIQDKIREIAILALQDDGLLDNNGNLIS